MSHDFVDPGQPSTWSKAETNSRNGACRLRGYPKGPNEDPQCFEEGAAAEMVEVVEEMVPRVFHFEKPPFGLISIDFSTLQAVFVVHFLALSHMYS